MINKISIHTQLDLYEYWPLNIQTPILIVKDADGYEVHADPTVE